MEAEFIDRDDAKTDIIYFVNITQIFNHVYNFFKSSWTELISWFKFLIKCKIVLNIDAISLTTLMIHIHQNIEIATKKIQLAYMILGIDAWVMPYNAVDASKNKNGVIQPKINQSFDCFLIFFSTSCMLVASLVCA